MWHLKDVALTAAKPFEFVADLFVQFGCQPMCRKGGVHNVIFKLRKVCKTYYLFEKNFFFELE